MFLVVGGADMLDRQEPRVLPLISLITQEPQLTAFLTMSPLGQIPPQLISLAHYNFKCVKKKKHKRNRDLGKNHQDGKSKAVIQEQNSQQKEDLITLLY